MAPPWETVLSHPLNPPNTAAEIRSEGQDSPDCAVLARRRSLSVAQERRIIPTIRLSPPLMAGIALLALTVAGLPGNVVFVAQPDEILAVQRLEVGLVFIAELRLPLLQFAGAQM